MSRAWSRTLAGSYTPVTRVTLTNEFQTGTSPHGTRITIVDGLVTLDGAADTYGSLDLSVLGEHWPDPRDLDSTLNPYGVEAYVETGVWYSDDLIELCPLGYYRVKRLAQADADRLVPIEVTGQDRMSRLARARLLTPRLFPADTTNGEFAEALVTEVMPDAVIVWDDEIEDEPLGRDILVEDSRRGALGSMAIAAGKVMRFDGEGQLVFFSPSNPYDSRPVATFASGKGGVLVNVARELTDMGVVNAIVARGDGADQTGSAYAVAYDLEPTSPTRYDGPFGPSPDFIKSSVITSNDQAVAAAQAELRRRAGLPHSISFQVSPQPHLTPDDYIAVQRGSVGALDWHMIASLTIPLMPGRTMGGATRQQLITPGVTS
jgi:hypothetical protein